MGCASSKRIEAAADVYNPAPASISVFDISTIDEPWLVKSQDKSQHQQQQEKLINMAVAPVLEKLHTFEFASDAPKPWKEVQKALEDIKPTLYHSPIVSTLPAKPKPAQPPVQNSPSPPKRKPLKRKSFSFHTLDELESKLSNSAESKSADLGQKGAKRPDPIINSAELPKFDRVKPELSSNSYESRNLDSLMPPQRTGDFKPVKENAFVVRDRMARAKEQRKETKWDPLSEFPEKCPPGGGAALVIYTTSLRGVRRTFEDCERVRAVLEGHGVVFDERDVALHGEFLAELRAILGEDGASVPRVFLKGRYLGAAEELVSLNESGRLGRLLSRARVERGLGWRACVGCGGKRFVPCLDCGGSCKVFLKESLEKERCLKCNENGLVQCPECH